MSSPALTQTKPTTTTTKNKHPSIPPKKLSVSKFEIDSLTRSQLQFLAKSHKLPANVSNQRIRKSLLEHGNDDIISDMEKLLRDVPRRRVGGNDPEQAVSVASKRSSAKLYGGRVVPKRNHREKNDALAITPLDKKSIAHDQDKMEMRLEEDANKNGETDTATMAPSKLHKKKTSSVSSRKKRKRNELHMSPEESEFAAGTGKKSIGASSGSGSGSSTRSKKRQKVRDLEQLAGETYVDVELIHLDGCSVSNHVAPTVQTFTTFDIRTLPRTELQTLARHHGVRANTKNKFMIDELFAKLGTYMSSGKDDKKSAEETLSDAVDAVPTNDKSQRPAMESNWTLKKAKFMSSERSSTPRASSLSITINNTFSDSATEPSQLLDQMPSMKLKELRKYCEQYGLKYKKKQKKAEVAELLHNHLSFQAPTNEAPSTPRRSPRNFDKATENYFEDDPIAVADKSPVEKSAAISSQSSTSCTQLTVDMIVDMTRAELEYHCTQYRMKIPQSKDTMRKKLVSRCGLDMLEFLALKKDSLPTDEEISAASRKTLQNYSKKFNLKANRSTEDMRRQLLEHVTKRKSSLRKEEIRQSPEKVSKTDNLNGFIVEQMDISLPSRETVRQAKKLTIPPTTKKATKNSSQSTTQDAKQTFNHTPRTKGVPSITQEEEIAVPGTVKFAANSKRTMDKRKTASSKNSSRGRRKFSPPRSALTSATEKSSPKPVPKKTAAQMTKKKATVTPEISPAVGKKRKAAPKADDEGLSKKRRVDAKELSKMDTFKSRVSKANGKVAEQTAPSTSPSTPSTSTSKDPFRTPSHMTSPVATLTSPSSLRKRTVPSPGKVQFTETQPEEFEYPHLSMDQDTCCLCHDEAPFGSAQSLVCDSCNRRFHRQCVTLRHGMDLDVRDRRVPFVCFFCLTGSTRPSRRASCSHDPKIHRRLLRSMMDIAVVPVRPRKKDLGLMDDGMDVSFWSYLESVEKNLDSFKTMNEFKKALFATYNLAIRANGANSRIGIEAQRLKKWFSKIFVSLELPMDAELVDENEGEDLLI
uniref:PHD-type domain-containing protein n=2 Tax=Percolomonas cosmopolitus TaxID=63605 RepID=A0A7S1KLW4_9EUKA